MRRLLESIADRLTGFVAQRDDLAMAVTTPAATAPAFLQVLAPIADTSTAGLFYTFDQPFRDPATYVEDVATYFKVWHDGYRAVRDGEGLPPWPAVPPVLAEPGVPPVTRLRELMAFSRSVLPQPDHQVVVWTFFPAAVADTPAYARFVRDLLAHDWPRPWCHHMRVIVRDDPADPLLRAALKKAPRIRWYEPPLGPDAYQKGFADAAADPTLPLAERMTALLITAATDASYGRHADALPKYELLIGYHGARRESVPLAAAWNGVGEVKAKLGDRAAAGAAFQVAMAHATDGPSPQPAVMYSVAWNLARLRMEEKRFAEAADYFAVAQSCAATLRAADIKLTAIEWHGAARAANGEGDKAVELWEAGATVAHGLNLPDQKEAMLVRLRHHLAADPGRVRELERRLAEPAAASA